MVYYHYISPNSNTIEAVLRKPIIILDGFDPEYRRDIDILYGQYLQYSPTDNFGEDMRKQGYDIIVLDFPRIKIGTAEIFKEQGADFIQRNAFVLVKLIEHVNGLLAANGITEQLVVIGPSMGGLISRYALRWMELNGKNHNTKLWISFDTPHKGANIPIGDQYFVDFYASNTGNEKAKKGRDISLNSPAAKQMLLHHFTANTTTPAGAPNFRNAWQTEIDNMGYPQNLRRIALINGAINGTTRGTACQNVYKLNAKLSLANVFFMFAGFINVAEGNIWFTGNNGSACQVFKGWAKLPPFWNATKSASAPASSKSYDIVPGGYYDTQATLGGGTTYEVGHVPLLFSITTIFVGTNTITSSQVLNPIHSFIPTFSALGMDITNKDLAENLYNRDLTCTGETPFQAYYAPLVNQEHITLTPENVAWIKAEIAGNKQPSSVNYAVLYPFVQTSGTDPACTNAIFQINNLPSGSTISWQSSNPSIATVPATGNPVTLTRQGTQSGAITITATITRPCSESNIVMTKTITVGIPSISSNSITAQRQGSDCLYDAVVTLSVPGTTVDFSYNNTTWFAGLQYGNTFRTGDGTFLGPKYVMIYARTHNTCGTSPVVSKNLYIPARPAGCTMSQPPVVSRTSPEQPSEINMVSQENISVYPNPAGNKLTVIIPPSPGNTVISIYDAGGKLVHKGRLNNPTNDLNISSFRAGLYLVRILRDGTIIKSAKIIKQ